MQCRMRSNNLKEQEQLRKKKTTNNTANAQYRK